MSEAARVSDDERLALRLAREAGALIAAAGGRPLAPEAVDFKGKRDPVTATDRASEALIAAGLAAARPDDGLLAEEQTARRLDARRLWIVDPLDGTVNFAHGHPLVAVSIALVVDGQPVAGAVALPLLGEAYSASAGAGARRWRGEQPPERLSVSRTARLDQALISTGFPYRREQLVHNNLATFNALFTKVRGLRRCGVASIDLAFVAAGIYDAYWEAHLAPHDVAAGVLLVREAGGRVTDYAGGDGWLYGKSIVASNGPLHEPLRALMPADFDADAERDD